MVISRLSELRRLQKGCAWNAISCRFLGSTASEAASPSSKTPTPPPANPSYGDLSSVKHLITERAEGGLHSEPSSLWVKGPLGELSQVYPREIKVVKDESGLIKVVKADDSRRAHEMHGLFRTLTDNMIVGVSQGFIKKLQLVGIGYRAAVEKNELVMNLGFSHQVRMQIPTGIMIKVEGNTKLYIFGRDKCAVGGFAASVRSWRPPEPYKGKGIKYADEVIKLKEGKKK